MKPAASGWRRLADEFLGSIRTAGPIDAVYFCLHGAMASENELDPEGYLLAETRRILGERVQLVESPERLIPVKDASSAGLCPA